MKKVKKSIISLILVCAIFVSAFAVSTVSVSAASAPKLNLVNPKSSGSFDVVWNIVPNAVKYRIYFGTNDGKGNGWRRFTVLNAGSCTKHPNYPSFTFTINSSSLRGRTWYDYGDDQAISTPSLNDKTVYKCQVEALGTGDKHLAWTNVDYAYVGSVSPVKGSIKYDFPRHHLDYNWNVPSIAEKYKCTFQRGLKYGYESTYNYYVNPVYRYFYDKDRDSDIYYLSGEEVWRYTKYTIKVRLVVKVNGKDVYGPWSNECVIRK